MPSEVQAPERDLDALILHDEAGRLAALARYDLMDTGPEAPFERVVRLAARLFRTPLAMVTVIDRERQWFKACVGTDLRENVRELSFCAHTILGEGVTVVPDAARDPRFAGNPVVTGLGIRFYAGAPLRTSDGFNIGTLCVYDTKPREGLSEDERETLADLAGTVMDDFEARLAARRALAAEAEVRALNADLERRVAKRTRELEERNSEAEAFVYTVSHDLRSPLLSINGMAGLLAEAVERGDPTEARFLLMRVRRNTKKMGELLNDLLALSRVGRLAEPAVGLDLAEVLAAAAADLEPSLDARGAILELPTACPAVHYPNSEAYQLVANLLGNAVKFAGRAAEAPRVVVSCAAEGGFVTLRVSDNGPGVPPEHRERVFDLFRKVDPASEGTGVGLAIVKRIAKRHGGSAWVEDSPPPPEGLGGATFAVTLPAEPPQPSSSLR